MYPVIYVYPCTFQMRTMWEKYYDEASAIIFVVDSADTSRLEEARLAYEAIIDQVSLLCVPVSIFANKQDMDGALTPGDLANTFYADQDTEVSAFDRFRVYPVSALSGDGVVSAMTAVIEEAKQSNRFK